MGARWDEAISKLKGAGATRALARLYLQCMCPAYRGVFSTPSSLCKPRRYLSDLNANSVRNSLEANSEFRCKCISKFIRGHSTGPPPPRVPKVSIHSTLRLVSQK